MFFRLEFDRRLVRRAPEYYQNITRSLQSNDDIDEILDLTVEVSVILTKQKQCSCELYIFYSSPTRCILYFRDFTRSCPSTCMLCSCALLLSYDTINIKVLFRAFAHMCPHELCMYVCVFF